MLERLRSALSPSMAVALLALFVALGGAGYAATGGNFILGNPNTATSNTTLTSSGAASTATLKLTNTSTTSGSTALDLTVPAGKAPLKVNRSTKVKNLNADLLDGLDSTSMVLVGTPVAATVNPANGAAGVVDVTNTGNGNGVRSATTDAGVYGEHVGPGGYGVAGRAGDSGHAVYGDNTGNGFAGYFEDKVHVGGDLGIGGNVSCTGCVDTTDIGNVNASSIVGKVGDADVLDGIDSTGFMRAAQGGFSDGQAVAIAPNATVFVGPVIANFIRLLYQCPASLGGNGTLRIINSSSGQMNLFVDSGGANPDYVPLGAGGFVNYPTASGGESFYIQAQGDAGVALISAASVHRATDCHVQALATVAR
jgi:hypothetical protein